MKRVIVIFFAGLFLLFFLVTSFSVKNNAASNTTVERALNNFAADPALKSASWGFYAVNLSNGKTIASHNADLALIPASTQKLVTTITALSVFGNDYRFVTSLKHRGQLNRQGVLSGNLYIRGQGDPSFGSVTFHDSLSLENVFQSWLAYLQDQGIKKVEGSVIADGSWFDDHLIPPKWMWEDMGNYYGAGAHALAVNENMYTVFFEPGKRVGDPAEVLRTDPEVPGMVLKNNVTTGPRGSGDRVYIYGSPYSNERWLTGTVPHGQSNFGVRGSLPDPGMFLASSFTRFLALYNIEVTGKPFTHSNAPAELMLLTDGPGVFWFSPELKHLAARTNFNSVNTYAENLFKKLGTTIAQPGSYAMGAEVVTDFWKKTGMDTQGLRIHDGSGLSPFNSITVRQLTHMLQFAAGNKELYEALTEGLPVANRSGSLAGMFSSTPSAGVLIAKSGFLSNVRSYAGYTTCRNGHLVAFTIIVNNYDGTPLQMRGKMETLMDALTRARF